MVAHAVLAFVLSFLIVAASTPLVRHFALRWKVGDKPNGRKVHTHTIPHLGGIAMVLGTLVSLSLLAWFFDTTASLAPFIGRMIVPVGVIVVLGLADDMRNLQAHQKLTVQLACALALAVSGFEFLVGVPVLDGNILFVLLLTTIYLVGMPSSVNLIDGLDGVAAGICLMAASAFALLASMLGDSTVLVTSLAVAGACLGFLLYNFPPGRIFMGDTGSMFLGIMLGIIACALTMRQPAFTTFVGVCLILSVPTIDCFLAIARRLALRQPVFQADHQHIHHVLLAYGLTPRQTLLVLYPIGALMGILGVLTTRGSMLTAIVGVAVLLVLSVTFFRLMVASKVRGEKVATTNFPHASVPSLEK